MDYASLAASLPVTLMAENRKWPDEIANTIEKAQYRVLESIHPDALRQEFTGSLDLIPRDPNDPDDTTVIEGSFDLTEFEPFGEIVSVRLLAQGRLRILLPRSYDFCTALYGEVDPGGAAPEIPKYYAEKITGIYAVFPIPGSNYEFHCIGNLRCPLVGPDGPSTNLLTDKYARLLEAAAAVEGAIWMKDNSAIQIWGSIYNERLKGVNDNIRRRRRDESTMIARNTENAVGAP